MRLRGRGGNRVKLVSVVERERPKQCTIVFVVELGGARIRDEDGGNMLDGGVCEICDNSQGYIVHHKTMLKRSNIDNTDVALNNRNLQ